MPKRGQAKRKAKQNRRSGPVQPRQNLQLKSVRKLPAAKQARPEESIGKSHSRPTPASKKRSKASVEKKLSPQPRVATTLSGAPRKIPREAVSSLPRSTPALRPVIQTPAALTDDDSSSIVMTDKPKSGREWSRSVAEYPAAVFHPATQTQREPASPMKAK